MMAIRVHIQFKMAQSSIHNNLGDSMKKILILSALIIQFSSSILAMTAAQTQLQQLMLQNEPLLFKIFEGNQTAVQQLRTNLINQYSSLKYPNKELFFNSNPDLKNRLISVVMQNSKIAEAFKNYNIQYVSTDIAAIEKSGYTPDPSVTQELAYYQQATEAQLKQAMLSDLNTQWSYIIESQVGTADIQYIVNSLPITSQIINNNPVIKNQAIQISLNNSAIIQKFLSTLIFEVQNSIKTLQSQKQSQFTIGQFQQILQSYQQLAKQFA